MLNFGDLGNFIGGIASALATGVIVKLLEDYVSYVPASYPNLRRDWTVRYKKGEAIVEGSVKFTQQLFGKVKGSYLVNEPDSSRSFEYTFKGKFLKRDELAIEFYPKVKADFTDQGYALLKLDPMHTALTGTAISFDLKTGKPRTFNIELKAEAGT